VNKDRRAKETDTGKSEHSRQDPEMTNVDSLQDKTDAAQTQPQTQGDKDGRNRLGKTQHTERRTAVGDPAHVAASVTGGQTTSTKRPRLSTIAEKKQAQAKDTRAPNEEELENSGQEDDDPLDIIELLQTKTKSGKP
jgi:hypothetical protein